MTAKALVTNGSTTKSKRALFQESIPFIMLQKYDYFRNLPKKKVSFCVFQTKISPVIYITRLKHNQL